MRFTNLLPADHPALKFAELAFAYQPLRLVKGMASAYIAYPLAELSESRMVTPKVEELRLHYKKSFFRRLDISKDRLVDTLLFCKQHVPYYKDLFKSIGFDPEQVRQDVQYLNALPYLTKEIIREQGERMLSQPLAKENCHVCKTGGSTGLSCVVYYDQEGADYSSSVTLYSRERVGNTKRKTEVHFACRFPDASQLMWPSREDYKCFAMNRSNIFFDRIDEVGLEEIWQTLIRRRPFMVHAHPSTIYALACYIENKYGASKSFEMFESSGELLQPYMRETISRVLGCKVVDRFGLAELGVVAYEMDASVPKMMVLESEVWPESRALDSGIHELVLTGFRNRLMPLIRYATGDNAQIEQTDHGIYLTSVVGRIHDIVPINGVAYPTHHIQDMLDHRVGGIQEFQVDLRTAPPSLLIVLEPLADANETSIKIDKFWPNGFAVKFVDHDALVRVGHRAKFRHVVTA